MRPNLSENDKKMFDTYLDKVRVYLEWGYVLPPYPHSK